MAINLLVDSKKIRPVKIIGLIDVFKIMADKNCLRVFACLNSGASLTMEEINKIIQIDDVLLPHKIEKLESLNLLSSQLAGDSVAYSLNGLDHRVSLLKKLIKI